MCEICYRSPCHTSCPNYEPEQIYTCGECENSIYEGDTYYSFDGYALCKECIDKHEKTAEVSK